tara:strand:+ start:462 stop:812 length:351 start_codon:yes stop_codon:yes gene_type:complete
MGGGTPIIMGGSTQSELQAQLERSALENERMLALAADEQLRLRDELAQRDREMASLIEQQSREQELDLAAAQRALAIEIDALENEDDKDDLEVDFSALEKALAQGMGGGNSGARPL